MKTKTNFKTGQQVRIKGLKDKFRYVSKNIVRNIKTGRFLAVNPEKIRDVPVNFWAFILKLLNI